MRGLKMAKEIPYLKFFTGEYLIGDKTVTKCNQHSAVMGR